MIDLRNMYDVKGANIDRLSMIPVSGVQLTMRQRIELFREIDELRLEMVRLQKGNHDLLSPLKRYKS